MRATLATQQRPACGCKASLIEVETVPGGSPCELRLYYSTNRCHKSMCHDRHWLWVLPSFATDGDREILRCAQNERGGQPFAPFAPSRSSPPSQALGIRDSSLRSEKQGRATLRDPVHPREGPARRSDSLVVPLGDDIRLLAAGHVRVHLQPMHPRERGGIPLMFSRATTLTSRVIPRSRLRAHRPA